MRPKNTKSGQPCRADSHTQEESWYRWAGGNLLACLLASCRKSEPEVFLPEAGNSAEQVVVDSFWLVASPPWTRTHSIPSIIQDDHTWEVIKGVVKDTGVRNMFLASSQGIGGEYWVADGRGVYMRVLSVDLTPGLYMVNREFPDTLLLTRSYLLLYLASAEVRVISAVLLWIGESKASLWVLVDNPAFYEDCLLWLVFT